MTPARRSATVALLVVWALGVAFLSLATAQLADVGGAGPGCEVVARSAHVDGICLDPG